MADHGGGLAEKLLIAAFAVGVIAVSATLAVNFIGDRAERWGWVDVVNPTPPRQQPTFQGTTPWPSPPGPRQGTPQVQHPAKPPPGMPDNASASNPYRYDKKPYWYDKPCNGTRYENPHDGTILCF